MLLLLIYSLLPKCGASLIEYIWKTPKSTKPFYYNYVAYTEEHFKENNLLIIYQLNVFNNLPFLHRVKN